ncbi:MAG: hypothetical protein Kow0099_17820 [Candidatus Abyssubacteria bacterium]
MTESAITYRRLPGKPDRYKGGIDFTYDRLWLADDHLLYVRRGSYTDNIGGSPYVETCKRFYLKDIQMLVITRTTKHREQTLVWLLLAGLFGAGAFLSTRYVFIPGVVAFAYLAARCGVNSLFSLLMGTACDCTLHTAVHAEKLRCLGRLRLAGATVDALKPIIEAAQGRLTEEWLSGGPAEVQPSPYASIGKPAVSAAPSRHEHGRVHAAVCWLLIFMGFSYGLNLLFRTPFKVRLDIFGFVPLMLVSLIALAMQIRTDLPAFVKAIPVSALVLSLFGFVFGVAVWERQFYVTSDVLSALEDPVSAVFSSGITVIFLLLGLVGLSKLHAFRGQYKGQGAGVAEDAAVSGPDEIVEGVGS